MGWVHSPVGWIFVIQPRHGSAVSADRRPTRMASATGERCTLREEESAVG